MEIKPTTSASLKPEPFIIKADYLHGKSLLFPAYWHIPEEFDAKIEFIGDRKVIMFSISFLLATVSRKTAQILVLKIAETFISIYYDLSHLENVFETYIYECKNQNINVTSRVEYEKSVAIIRKLKAEAIDYMSFVRTYTEDVEGSTDEVKVKLDSIDNLRKSFINPTRTPPTADDDWNINNPFQQLQTEQKILVRLNELINQEPTNHLTEFKTTVFELIKNKPIKLDNQRKESGQQNAINQWFQRLKELKTNSEDLAKNISIIIEHFLNVVIGLKEKEKLSVVMLMKLFRYKQISQLVGKFVELDIQIEETRTRILILLNYVSVFSDSSNVKMDSKPKRILYFY